MQRGDADTVECEAARESAIKSTSSSAVMCCSANLITANGRRWHGKCTNDRTHEQPNSPHWGTSLSAAPQQERSWQLSTTERSGTGLSNYRPSNFTKFTTKFVFTIQRIQGSCFHIWNLCELLIDLFKVIDCEKLLCIRIRPNKFLEYTHRHTLHNIILSYFEFNFISLNVKHDKYTLLPVSNQILQRRKRCRWCKEIKTILRLKILQYI